MSKDTNYGNYRVRSLTCRDQFFSMTFGQLTYRESLRDIIVCLKAQNQKLYHLGFRSQVSRPTLTRINEKRDWRIYRDFAQILIQEARRLYCDDQDFNLELHLMLDLNGNIPAFFRHYHCESP